MHFSRSRRVRQSLLLLGALFLVLLVPADRARAQNSETSVKEYITNVKQELDAAVDIAGGLRIRARVAIAITVVAAFLSLASGLVPQLKKKWSKPAALVLGFLAGTTTIVNNNFFGVDSTLLEDNSYELEREVATMRDRLDTFGLVESMKAKPEYEDNVLTWHTDTVHQMSKFRDRREELRRPARRRPQETREVEVGGRSSPAFFATLHAQAQQMQQRVLTPSWVQKAPPEDARFVYFVGKGVHPDSLTEAKDLSARDAYRQAEMFLAARANSCSIPALRDRAAKEAEIVATHFGSGTVDSSNMRAYTYSTLLRLSKALADPAMLRALAARATSDLVKLTVSRVGSPAQLGGSIGVYAGPGTAGNLRIVVFNTTNVATRWPPSRNVRYEELKKGLSPAQILQDVSLGRCGETAFRAGDMRYVLTVIELRSTGADQSASVAIAAERLASARN